MTIETEVAALTTATTDLLSAVNVSKATLDTKVADATTQAGLATTNGAAQVTLATTQANTATAQAAIATTKADEADTSAVAAEAARAAAVVAQNNAVATVTGGTASLTAAASKIPISDASAVLDPGWLENNQTYQRLMGAIAFATDLAGHAAGSPLVLTPGTPSGTTVGNPGNVAFDANYLYVCTAKNVWKRVALTAF
jgi:hypothetical protein